MNVVISRCRQLVLLGTLLVAVNVGAVMPEKCKPCAAAAAARLSAAAAAAASLAAGKPVSREMELDAFNPAEIRVEACCTYCAQVGSLGCQGENSARCNTCQAGLVKISIAEAAAAALALTNTVAKKRELDKVPSVRAPREELVDPCDTCDVVEEDDACELNCKLQAIFDCCVNTNMQVRCQGHEFDRCCKKIRHTLNDLEDEQDDVVFNLSVVEGLIGSQIDQSAACCSVIDTRIGDLAGAAFDIPDTDNILSFVDTMDADVITWLKSLYVLAYNMYQCTCLN